MRVEQCDVLIVGGGPTGLTLALELGLRGVHGVLVEKNRSLSPIPKGQALSQRTMEHFRRWGIESELRASRQLPNGYPTGMLSAYESLSSDHFAAPPARGLVHQFYATTNERVPQYETERVLRERLRSCKSVSTRFGSEMTEIEVEADGVRAWIREDDSPVIIDARYVVGCDGARSSVRRHLDLPRHGREWGEVMLLATFRSPSLHALLQRLPERSTYRIMHRKYQGYWMFVGRVDVGEHFFFHAPLPKGVELDHVDVPGLIKDAAGAEVEIDVEHVGTWDLRVAVAESYQWGAGFIAGDAAHTHPPYGGFGLNNGVEDAVNLAWKLAAVIDGWAGARLLDSYTLERQPVFRDVADQLIAGWIDHDRAFLDGHSPGADGPDFPELFEGFAKEYGRRYSSFEPHYDGSPVVVADAEATTGGVGEHQLRARAGHHLAPVSLGDSLDTFEVLGPEFTLFAFGPQSRPVGEAFAEVADRLAIPLAVVEGPEDAGLQYEAALILVRPDQYIAWTSDRLDGDPADILRRVTARGSN